ncbi:MAG: hypothetical protein K6D94_06780, partial [Clostridiales bacterium]|nr:hypothetical protein [Clostridiales bacterium]
AAKEYRGDESVLYPFVDIYAGTQITDVLFCNFCQYSASDSRIWSDYADKYEQTTENGVAVDYKDLYEGLYTFNKKFGIDPYAVWLKRCREKGLNGWISIRMNDCHCPDDEASFLRSDFFYESREKGWNVGEKYGYYRWCFDYAVDEVRRRMLGYIEEQLDRYDPDGIELDFQREMVCFDYLENKDCAKIMTDFMRRARKLVKQAEIKRGHKIRLGIRLQRDIKQCLTYGFDAKTFISEKLVDLIVVTPRWETCDSDMPIEDWKKLAEGSGVEIAAGLEILVRRPSDEGHVSAAVRRGYAASYLSRGADSIYLFNYFMNPYDSLWADEINRTAGDLATACSLPRRFVVTWQDIAPIGQERWEPLPIRIDSGSPAVIQLKLGPVPDGKKASLIIGIGGFDISKCGDGWVEYAGSIAGDGPEPRYYGGGRLYRKDIDIPASGELELSFDMRGPCVIDYIEIEVY